MKRILAYALITAFSCAACFAQADTSYQYFSKNWKVASRDSAYYYTAFFKSNELFKRRDFIANTKSLYMEGGFSDKDLKNRQGNFKWYYGNGVLKDSVNYENGKRTAGWYFYENGKTKAVITLADGKVTEQKGWDENGKEIENYVVDEPAKFPNGTEGWKRYLEKSLNKSAASEDNAPNGNYTVKVQFEVDKEGNIIDIKPVTIPPLCPTCVKEAVRVLQKGPKWIPAIQFGKAVNYKVTQYFTFQRL